MSDSTSGNPESAGDLDMNSAIIAEFRATGRAEMFGDVPIVVLHTTGAKSGKERMNPLAGIREDDGTWLVSASNAGRDPHPSWYHNLLAHPEVTLETPEVRDGRGIAVVASIVDDADRDEQYARFVAMHPGFAGYETTTDRRLPVVRLTPVATP